MALVKQLVQFVNPIARDLHLQAGSAGRGIAASASGIRYDLDWGIRDRSPDVGAYEYHD